MRIAELNTTVVDLPLPMPVETAIHSMRSVGCVLLELRTDDGLVGQSFAFTLNGDRIRAFDEMITGLGDYVVGRDPHDTEAIWHDIWSAINPTGHKGVTVAALATLDVACWDIVGKAAGRPLHKLFGACRDTVDTYASSGLWLSTPVDMLPDEAMGYIEHGFHAIKLRIGSPTIAEDVARVEAVRQAVGPDIGVLVDANQAFTPKHAIRLAHALEPYDLVWIEEPVSADDLDGHAQVRTASVTPIASGETEYTRFGMQAMINARSADILMPDLQRIGGYSEFRKAAATASANHLPVSSHFFTEYSLAIAGSTANSTTVEHKDRFAPLLNE